MNNSFTWRIIALKLRDRKRLHSLSRVVACSGASGDTVAENDVFSALPFSLRRPPLVRRTHRSVITLSPSTEPLSLSLLHTHTHTHAALAELSVRPAESYAVLEGESETIICDSETALFYSWEKDGIPIDGSVPGLVASDNTLSITNANHTLHRGRYSCTVTESDSFSFTADFTVAVHC